MPALTGSRNGLPHQPAAEALAARLFSDGQRAEQQRRAAGAGRDVPQPDGADDAAITLGCEGEALRRKAILPQALGGLEESRRAEAAVEQGFARARNRLRFQDG